MKVAKFGGSSLSTAEQIKKVCKIIISDPDRKVIVVSAPGKRYKEDTKITDLLIKCAEESLAGGTANFMDPTACIGVIQGIENYMREHNHSSLDEIVGKLQLN
jgi:aspartokinase